MSNNQMLLVFVNFSSCVCVCALVLMMICGCGDVVMCVYCAMVCFLNYAKWKYSTSNWFGSVQWSSFYMSYRMTTISNIYRLDKCDMRISCVLCCCVCVWPHPQNAKWWNEMDMFEVFTFIYYLCVRLANNNSYMIEEMRQLLSSKNGYVCEF